MITVEIKSSSSSDSDRMVIVLDPEEIVAMDTSTAEGDDTKDKYDSEEKIENAEKLKDVNTGAEEQKDADAAASEGATSGAGDASVNPSAVRVDAGRSMNVDDATPVASVLSTPDYINRINNELANTTKTEYRANILMNQTIMDIVEDELQKVTESICVGPPEDEPWYQVAPPSLMSQPPPQESQPPPEVSQPPPLEFQPPSLACLSRPLMFQPPPLMYQSSPQLTQPPPRASTSDFSVRSGPSRREPYALDYLLAHRPPRREPLRPARLSRYDRANRDVSVTTALRRSRIVRSGRRGYDSDTQPPPLVYPALYPTQQHAAREPETYQTIRQLLNTSISIVNPSQTLTPRFTRQYNPQSPPMVFKQASSPMRLTTSRRHGSMSSSSQSGLIASSPATLMPRSPPSLVSISKLCSSPISCSQSPSSVSTELFDLPYVSDEPQQPLDLSLLPRQLPTLIPISKALIACSSETVARPRFTPITHTVTSTSNNVVYFPHNSFTRTEEPYQTTNRIVMYKSCSEHLLNRPPTRHRTRTPTDILAEYQQDQTWPVDNLTQTDHTEEVKSTEVDAWFDAIEASDIEAAVAASLQYSQPAPVTHPPPMICIVPPLSLVRSPDTTRATSPPRTTSS